MIFGERHGPMVIVGWKISGITGIGKDIGDLLPGAVGDGGSSEVGGGAATTAGDPSGSAPMAEGGILLPLRPILEVNSGISGPLERPEVYEIPSTESGRMEGIDKSVE